MGFFSDEELEKMRNSENAKADRERLTGEIKELTDKYTFLHKF